jgi:ribosomal protein S18 acetylase RimI-like enzyme
MVRETNMQVVEFYKRIGYDPMPRINMQKWLKALS